MEQEGSSDSTFDSLLLPHSTICRCQYKHIMLPLPQASVLHIHADETDLSDSFA